MEECFIHLYETFQHVGLVREATPKGIKPVPHCLLGELREAHGLSDGNLGSPGPEHCPELLEWQLHIRKPGMREQAESLPTVCATVSQTLRDDLSRTTPGTKHVLAEQVVTQELHNLRFRRYLVQVVHILHGSEYVTTGSDYPCTDLMRVLLDCAIL